MRLFLTSEFAYSGDYLKQTLPLEEKKHTVAYVANAADLDSDKSWMQHNRDKFLKLGFEIKDIDLKELDHTKLREKLEEVDAIYVEGGNTFYLLHLSNESGFTEIVKDLVINHEKLYIGTSTGSIIAGPNIESTTYIDDLSVVPDLIDYAAFKLVNFVIIPHIGNDEFFKEYEKEYNKLFANLKNYPYPHICLRDNQAVWVEKGCKIIEI